eukprot:TRINITY_DN606_c2_g1_i3.p1 TRINITY_DN606_c2_g1~~TRINITY_DN606_c2_g1_i3.p1  ORF type:complete len:331 (+),score=101.60 TRINITY_DN606_c2_g1_i3:396-1388(+)
MDGDEVKKLLERQKRQRSNPKRFKLQLSEEEERRRILMKKEKRRLQEKYRRQRKIQENQRILQDRYKAGSKDGTLPGGNVNLKCGRCGMFGHMKTNKSCPVYVHDENEENEKKEKEDKEKPEKKEKSEKVTKESDKNKDKESSKPDKDVEPAVKVKGTSLRISTKVMEESKKNSVLGKRKASEFEDDDISQDRPSSQRKRPKRVSKSDPKGVMKNILEDCWRAVNENDKFIAFREKVDRKQFRDYYDIIEEPMDLSTIKKKLTNHEYDSSEAFRADFELMRDNCHKYNKTRYVNLLPLSDELLDTIDQKLAEKDMELRELEFKSHSDTVV